MGGVRKVITTNIGTAYTLTLNIDMGTAEGLYIMPRTTNGGNIYTGTNLAQVYVTSSGTHTVTFTASTSTTQLLVEKAGTVTQTFYIDNVKVEQSTPTLNSYPIADVVSAQHYYPFGSTMQTWEADGKEYVFGFNGMYKDNEVQGDGNSYDYGARVYDSRSGRWLSLDPHQIKYPGFSPYNYVSNSPICLVDPDGRDNIIYLVVLPETYAKLSPATVDKIIAQANSNFDRLRLETRVVMFQPAPLPKQPFNPSNMDPTDAVAVLGDANNVANYIKNNIDAKFGDKLLEPKGWVERVGTKDVTNPENSELGQEATADNPANVIAMDVGDLIDMGEKAGLTTVQIGGLTINHGAGHNADNTVYDVRHHDRGVMVSGSTMEALNGQNYDYTNPEHNALYKANMEGKFGINKAQDNYQRNYLRPAPPPKRGIGQ
jgi:RHS repeat-associated protein